jgi:hypothetical protein
MGVCVRCLSLVFVLSAMTFVHIWQSPVLAQGKFSEKFGRSVLAIETGDGKQHKFRVEIAQTSRQQMRGLMFRRQLAADAGMLFFYGGSQIITMWMKNTYIPLDMIFIRGDGVIMEIAERTIPGSLAIISSGAEVSAVLELNGGTVSRLGIVKGNTIRHAYFGNAR